MSDIPHIPAPEPFWFADSQLLAEILRAEIRAVNQLVAMEPGVRSLFDLPEATVSQRKHCFIVLAHAKVLDVISEAFAGRYEQSPALNGEDSSALRVTRGLVVGDAPNWVLEMDRVVEHLPYHLFEALPQPLHAGSFAHYDAEKSVVIESAAKTFGTVEQIQKLIERVLDQQLDRLERRWLAATPVIANQTHQSAKKRKIRRSRDTQRTNRDKLIAEIAGFSETPAEFIALMDERKVKPQPTWSAWRGTWKESYKDRDLRALIQQDKSRALVRTRRRK